MSSDQFIDNSFLKEKLSTEYAIVFDPNHNMDELFEKEVPEMAKEFEFKLDPFQMQAVICLERHQNVLVAAHTSAGKTVVADYAIAMAFRSMSRVIYTSPIKALSNQKYRDFKTEFNDVGILTGDVQIDSEAKCLVMTTEILLQMLYNKSEVINDLEFVVFDECHYVNDRDRGHVWEEIFILLPKTCNLVLLSATVPNVVQFADWLGRARNRPTYVVSTSKRPVPLQHYLFTGRDGKTKDQKFLIVNSEGKFLNDNYVEAVEVIDGLKQNAFMKEIKRHPNTEKNIYLTLIRHLNEQNLLPAIFFTLSRNRCDSNLENLMSVSEESLNLIDRERVAKIKGFVRRHLSRLKECDRKLPQIQKTIQMLERGFGVHHSGILPILKEITEILFSEGLIRVLVATETFAMGVNMPARTVVFDSIDKHDGTGWRDLKPSEYIQMAGRAGRRGKDKFGNVLILCKYDIPDSPRLVSMMQGSPTELESQFRVTYHMICNLHKTCDSDQLVIEKFLEQSFVEHNRLKQSLDVQKQLSSFDSKISSFPSIECDICSDIENFYKTLEEYLKISDEIMPIVCQRAQEKRKLTAGRVVAIVGKENPFESAVVLRINKGKNNEISTLTVLSIGSKDKNGFEYQDIDINCVHKILNKDLGKKFDSKSIIDENEKSKSKHNKENTINAIQKLKDLNLDNNYSLLTIDSIDPKKTLQIREIAFVHILDQFIQFGEILLTFNCIKCKDFVKHFEAIKQKMNVLNEKEILEYKLSTQSLQFLPDYESRLKVLKTLDYMDDNLVLKLKGRIACLISEHELVITEMLLNNVIGVLEPEEIAAIFSAFVFQQSKPNERLNKDMPFENLKKKRNEIKDLEDFINVMERQYGVPQSIDPVLNFDLMEFVYEWAKGKSFLEVLDMELTTAQEGIIVRCIQRLDELIKYIKMASKLMGNKELEDKMEKASQVIRRDIVFCQSLYTITDQKSNDKENQQNIDENLSSDFI